MYVCRVASAWCTSNWTHESTPYGCLFGCWRHEDDLSDYLVCPVLKCPNVRHLGHPLGRRRNCPWRFFERWLCLSVSLHEVYLIKYNQ